MGLIVTEINELRQRLRNFDDGKIDTNELTAAISVYTQTEKRMRLYLKAMSLGVKIGGVEIDDDIIKQMLGPGKIEEKKKLYDRTASRGKK